MALLNVPRGGHKATMSLVRSLKTSATTMFAVSFGTVGGRGDGGTGDRGLCSSIVRPIRKPLSAAALSLRGSAIRETMALASALENDGSGEPVLHLEVGQPDFDAPLECVLAAQSALNEPEMLKYISNAGIAELRESVALFYSRGRRLLPRSSAEVTAENVLIGNGAVCSMATAFQATLDPGDEVLIPDPAWPNYAMGVGLFGPGKVVTYPLDPAADWMPDLDELRRRITNRTKVLVIASPSNPTGTVLDIVTMQTMLDIAAERGLYVISDEIYASLNFDEGNRQAVSALDCDHDPSTTFVVSGVSKAWAMTGFRVGWLIAPTEVVAIGMKIQEAILSCGFGPAQRAATIALNDPSMSLQVDAMVRKYRLRRDLALGVLRSYGIQSYTPGGGMYLLVSCASRDVDSTAFSQRLLREHRVAVSPGSAFGNVSSDYVRISFGAKDEVVEEGMDRLCRALVGVGGCKGSEL
eukprot:TRINITY_DN38816_c0_g1_i1.p1 TRINITY_DN38816_c0_g1~~TRINITY_DN38816_c0_g1_i1.p1  ORF type:complete len:468 (-),score=65.88 TRINITY_DN38816_c0_g1_i1:77-1480(-)